MTKKQAMLILGIDINRPLNLNEITSKYRKLMMIYHPDKHVNEEEKRICAYNRKCSMLNEAYDVLKSSLEFEAEKDNEFIFMKNKTLNEIKSRFENCSDSILKSNAESIFRSNVSLDDCKDVIELDEQANKFYSTLKIYYRNYEISFKRQNGIPKKFEFALRYDCNTDEFITQLEELQKAYDQYINNKLNGIIYTYFNAGDSIILSSYLDNMMDGIKSLLYNYNLFDYEENKLFDDFREFIKSKYDYYTAVSLEYRRIKKYIDKLPGNYEDGRCAKSKLLTKLNDSVFKENFDTVKDEVTASVFEFEDREKALQKLHRLLVSKSSLMAISLKISKDKSKLDYVYRMMSKCSSLLKMASEGKYSIQEISILENITFSDETTDKMLLTMLDNKLFNIYVRIPNDTTEEVLYDPFVLRNKDGEFLSIEDENNITLESSEEAREKNQMFSLNDIINYGSPIFRNFNNGETSDITLYQYNGYELVCNYNTENGSVNEFYLRGITDYRGLEYCNKFDIRGIVSEKVKNMFRPYTSKIQKKSKTEKTLKINSI